MCNGDRHRGATLGPGRIRALRGTAYLASLRLADSSRRPRGSECRLGFVGVGRWIAMSLNRGERSIVGLWCGGRVRGAF